MLPFSFGRFVGFGSAFEAATSLGALTLAAGGMTTSARLGYLLDNEVTVIFCTPTYALRMLEVAADEGLDMASSAVRLLIVGGEPGGSIPSVRSRLESGWVARVFDHVGMAEVGAVGRGGPRRGGQWGDPAGASPRQAPGLTDSDALAHQGPKVIAGDMNQHAFGDVGAAA